MKKYRLLIIIQLAVSSLLAVIMIATITLAINSNKNISKKISLEESEERMKFNVENTIKRIEYYKKYFEEENVKHLDIVREYLKNMNNLEEIIENWKNLQSSHTVFENYNFSISEKKSEKILYTHNAINKKSYYNGTDEAKFIEFVVGDFKIKASILESVVYNSILSTIRGEMHNAIFTPNEYVWINQINNYEGGNNYAIRLVHPNLVITEGTYLSTYIEDSKGNFPYATELIGVVENIKNNKGYFQDYYFKNKVNDNIELKRSYAKLYKPYNWIIATGIPYNDIYNSLNTIYKENMGMTIGIGGLFFILITCANLMLIFIQKKESNAKFNSLNEINKVKSDFFAKMSHDMRSPLNGILGITSITKSENKGNKILNEHLDQINISAEYLKGLIDDTLNIHKMEIDKFKLIYEEVNFFEIADEIKHIINTSIMLSPNKNIQLKWSNNVKQLDNLVLLDSVRFKEIFINLISNAIKFTTKENSIAIMEINEISRTEDILNIEVTIEDNGIGISKEFLSKIFLPYEQEHDATIKNYAGTGLGLSIVKKLVDLMDGTINIESKKNIGTKVFINLPIKISKNKIIVKKEKEKINLDSLKGINVLYCEDHPLNAKIIEKILEKVEVKVDIAINGKEGLEKFKNSKENYYGLILMDIKMPIMDGIEATKQIRLLDRKDAKDIPIIALSANAFDEDKENSLKAGMNDHLSKPINTEELYSTILNFIEK